MKFKVEILSVFLISGQRKSTFLKQMDHCSSPGTFILVFSAWISCCAAFYLPGLAPVSYCEKGKESKACWVSVVLGSISSLIIAKNLRLVYPLFGLIFRAL